MPVYAEGTGIKPSEIAKRGLEEAKKKKIDVIIVDTAGRLQVSRQPSSFFFPPFLSFFSVDLPELKVAYCSTT